MDSPVQALSLLWLRYHFELGGRQLLAGALLRGFKAKRRGADDSRIAIVRWTIATL